MRLGEALLALNDLSLLQLHIHHVTGVALSRVCDMSSGLFQLHSKELMNCICSLKLIFALNGGLETDNTRIHHRCSFVSVSWK